MNKWLKMELLEKNIGDNETPYSATWLFNYYLDNFGKLYYRGEKIISMEGYKKILLKNINNNSQTNKSG